METKPNDYAYSSNASPSLPPPSSARIATRIELIRGAKLNTRILIITRGGGGGPTKIFVTRTLVASSTFYQPKNIFIPLLRRMNYPSIVNEYAQVKSPFRTIGGGVNGIFAMVE